MKELDFYEEIGNWDFSQIKYETEKLTDWDFYERIKKYTDKNSVCLDLGTGAGEKLLAKYPNVRLVIGTDYSDAMLRGAKINLEKSGRKDVRFAKMDNLQITLPDELLDLISARHTVIDAKQLYKSLRKGGIVVIQGVEKLDCQELKEMFKRGQAYKDKVAISQLDYEQLVNAGFEIVEKKEVLENEYFETKEDLLALLLKTPILDDFSEIEENNYGKKSIEMNILDEYIKKNTTEKGILLKRVLYGIVAVKR
ncbi:MAG: methyltransferase domain-containing protein [Clostridia bacterium]|nr:methyltransferase domain-containing protein [Clostridia bacterium]